MQKRAVLSAAVSLIALGAAHSAMAQSDPSSCTPSGMTFDDEFDGNTVDWSKWSPAQPYAPNGSKDSSMSSWEVNPTYKPTSAPDANTFSVNNGVLTIKIMPLPSDVNSSDVGGAQFLSGQLITKNRFSQLYGYFEIRAIAPATSGVSSAFWAIPESGAWPPELDMPEWDSAGVDWGVHGVNNQTPTTWTYGSTQADGFHVYGVDWEKDNVRFYMDSDLKYTVPTPSNMNEPMYLLLDALTNTGGWNGTPPSGYTGGLQVDYVRAWASKAAHDAAGCSSTPSTTVAQTAPTQTSVSATPPAQDSTSQAAATPASSDQSATSSPKSSTSSDQSASFKPAGTSSVALQPAGGTSTKLTQATSSDTPTVTTKVAKSSSNVTATPADSTTTSTTPTQQATNTATPAASTATVTPVASTTTTSAAPTQSQPNDQNVAALQQEVRQLQELLKSVMNLLSGWITTLVGTSNG